MNKYVIATVNSENVIELDIVESPTPYDAVTDFEKTKNYISEDNNLDENSSVEEINKAVGEIIFNADSNFAIIQIA